VGQFAVEVRLVHVAEPDNPFSTFVNLDSVEPRTYLSGALVRRTPVGSGIAGCRLALSVKVILALVQDSRNSFRPSLPKTAQVHLAHSALRLRRGLTEQGGGLSVEPT
jgi:hypothetical protein